MSTDNKRSTAAGSRLLLGGAALGYYFFVRPQLLKWGTELGESQRRLPGDGIVPEPNFQITHAINIDAPPEAVWPWLAQMGREHTGYYGLDILENRSIPSITFLRQDIRDPEVGMQMDGGYHIIEMEPNRKLIYGAFNLCRWPVITQDLSALYLLERRRDGSTRLLARHRAYTYGSLATVFNLVYELAASISTIRQLQNLKRLAESMAHLKTSHPS